MVCAAPFASASPLSPFPMDLTPLSTSGQGSALQPRTRIYLSNIVQSQCRESSPFPRPGLASSDFRHSGLDGSYKVPIITCSQGSGSSRPRFTAGIGLGAAFKPSPSQPAATGHGLGH
ncbi:hypothetical protein KIL84_000955 [Mauremys mutica]|uniref:Uncharacterized protein n=1 Tax=Mauremys mutica TaxID=74926 RepID=A0A9D3WZU7_9SAUR|nr:hypothetical protein KIL84_000955 [Mauremys mutica]